MGRAHREGFKQEASNTHPKEECGCGRPLSEEYTRERLYITYIGQFLYFSHMTGHRTLPNMHVRLLVKSAETVPGLTMGWHPLPFDPQKSYCACVVGEVSLSLEVIEMVVLALSSSRAQQLTFSLTCQRKRPNLLTLTSPGFSAQGPIYLLPHLTQGMCKCDSPHLKSSSANWKKWERLFSSMYLEDLIFLIKSKASHSKIST